MTNYTLPAIQTHQGQKQGQGAEQLWALKPIANYSKKFPYLYLLLEKAVSSLVHFIIITACKTTYAK